MPLHVNLYHEIQSQERARRRDPLRLSAYGLILIAIGFVVNYIIVLGSAHLVGSRFEQLQAQYSKLEPKAKDAKARQTELDDEISASDTMMKSVDSRFYWAPVLDEVLQTVPRNVQLTHMGGDTATNSDPKAGAPSVLNITGIASAAEPRKEAENLREALNARLGKDFQNVSAVFKNLDDSDQVVVLDGRSLPTATFTIEIQLEPKAPDAAPAPAAHKSKLASNE